MSTGERVIGRWRAGRRLAVVLTGAGALVALASPMAAGVGQWTTRGPYGGAVASLALDPTNPANLLASDQYNVYRSTDRGCTWTDVGFLNGRPEGIALMQVSVAPTTATFYLGVGGGSGSIFRSTNLGATWTPLNGSGGGALPGNLTVGAVAAAPSNPNRLYAANPVSFSGLAAIWISSDGGLNWSPGGAGMANVPVHEILVHPTNQNTVYAWERDGTSVGLFRSTDGGLNFTHVGPLVGPGFFSNRLSGVDIDRVNPNILYASNFHGRLWKTTNSGTSWTELFPGTTDIHRLIVDPLRPTTVYFEESSTRLFKSTDGGASWSTSSTRPPFRGQPFDLAINRFNPAEIYSVNNGGAANKSTNAGATWSAIRLGIAATDVQQIVVDPSDPSTLYAATYADHLQKSTDGGDTWTAISEPTFVERVAVAATDPQRVVYGDFFGTVRRSTDGGATFSFAVECRGGIGAIAIDPTDEDIVYLRCWLQGTDYNGDGLVEGILKSTDGGNTFQAMNNGLPSGVAADGQWRTLAISRSNPQVLYTGRANTASTDTIWRTTDGGATWVDVGTVPGFLMDLEVDPTDPMTVWGASGFGGGQGVFRSTDGGVTFAARNGGLVPVPPTPAGALTVQDIAINPNEGNELVIALGASGVWRTTDAGASWTQLDGAHRALRDNPITAVAIDPGQPRRFFAGGFHLGVRKLDLVSASNPAGVTVTPIAGLYTTEEGTIDRFEVVLDRPPTANVTISLTSSDTTEGTVAPASLTFTPGNWSTPQIVTVTGVDDSGMGVVDGAITYTITTGNATSSDGAYSGLPVDDVTVINLDKDIPGVIVVPAAGLVTTETGGTDSFSVVLNSHIDAGTTVTVSFASSDTTEGTVPASVTFTDANELTPQTVTVTGVADGILDGDQPYTIVTQPAVSGDPDYQGLDPLDVSAINRDNGVGPRLTATKSDALQVDGGVPGQANPSDRLRYTVTIANTGNAAASTVRFVSDDLAAASGLALVVGSVAAPGGTVVRGNTAGDTVVEVTYASVAASGTVVLTFDADVVRPFPVGRTQVSCQGTVSSTVVSAFRTDDPATAALADPTVTPVVATATLTATKTATQTLDLDGDGRLDPGDRLQYEAIVTNVGDRDASAVFFDDVAPAGIRLLCAGPAPAIVGAGTLVSCGAGEAGRILVEAPLLAGAPGPAGTLTVRFTAEVASFDAAPRLVSANLATAVPPTQVCNTALVTGYGGGGFTAVTSNGGTPVCRDLDVATVTASKTFAQLTDGNGDGDVDAGERVRYTVTLDVTANGAAGAVRFRDFLGAFARFDCATLSVVPAATSQTCTAGTGVPPSYGELDLAWSSLATGTVTIGIDGVVNASLPDFVSDTHPICNWGAVSGRNHARDLTGTTAANDLRTCVPIVANPVVAATKTDALVVDVDGDSQADAGDTLRYTVTITNTGDRDANAVSFAVPAGTDTTLVAGSVTTTAGSVTTGNGAGDTSVLVTIGGIPPLVGLVTVTFDVVVDLPLAVGVTEVACQGTVAGSNFLAVPTDDPATAAPADATLTPVLAVADVAATKVDALVVDADGDGEADPGDTLRYTVVLTNDGDRNAGSVVFTSAIDPATDLVVGSVTTTQGSVTTGNGAGDTAVAVAVGTLAGVDGAVTITFDVVVRTPAPIDLAAVSCQGLVTGVGFTDLPTDDPDVGGAADPTVTPVTAAAAVSATKDDALVDDADANGVASAGDTLRYTVTLTNDGDRDVAGLDFASGVDPLTTLVVGSVTTTQGSITTGNGAGDGTVLVSVGDLPGDGGSVTVTFDALLGPLPVGVLELVCQGETRFDTDGAGGADRGTVTDDPATATPLDPTRTPLVTTAVLDATKADALLVDADADGVAEPGDTLLYTVVVTNAGNAAAASVVFRDTPDPVAPLDPGSVTTTVGTIVAGNGGGDTTVEVDLGALAAGDVVTVTFTATIGTPPPGIDEVANQGVVTATGLVDTPTDDPATATPDDPTVTPLVARAALTVTKDDTLAVDADGDGRADPGDVLLYTLQVANAGNAVASAVLVTDTVDAQTTLLPGPPVCGSVFTTHGAVTACDAPSGLVEAALGDLGPEERAVVRFAVQVVSPVAAGTTEVVNQASAEGAGVGPVASDDPATAAPGDPTRTPIDAAAEIVVTKVAALAVDLGGDTMPSPGDTLEYTVVVRNDGDMDAAGVVFVSGVDPATDLVVGSVTTTQGAVTTGNGAGDTSVAVAVGGLAGGGGTVTVTFRALVRRPLAAGVGQVSCQGAVTATGLPATPTDDPTTAAPADPTVTPIVAAAALTAEKVWSLAPGGDGDGDGQADAGDRLRYTMVVANAGDQDAAGVVFTSGVDPATVLVAGAVTTTQGAVTTGNAGGDTTVAVAVGTLAGDGATVTVTFDVVVGDPLAAGVDAVSCQGQVDATGSAALPTDDPTTAAPTDATVTPIDAAPDLAVAKGDGGVSLTPGAAIVYTIDWENQGNQGATGVVLTETVPADTTFTGPAGWTCGGGIAGDTCTFAIGALAAGEAGTTTFEVVVDAALPAAVLSVVNTVAIGDDGTNGADPDPGDDSAFVTTSRPRLLATKADTVVADADSDGLADPGDTLHYTVLLENDGALAATSVVFTAPAMTHGALVVGSVTATAGVVALGNGAGHTTVQVDVGTLGVGATATITYRVLLAATVPAGVGSVSCQGLVEAAETADAPTDDPATPALDDATVTPLDAEPDLVVTKDDGGAIAVPGTVLVYQVGYRNAGDQDAAGVLLTETVPADTTFVAGSSDASWMCGGTAAGSTCTLAVGPLAVGAAPVLVDFAVLIDDPLPLGVSAISNTVTIGDDGTNGTDPTPSDNAATEVTSTDEDPPAIAAVDSTPATDLGLEECEELRRQPSLLLVSFDETMADPAGDIAANDVTNPAGYLIVGTGPDRDLQTAACAGVGGDDVAATVTSVTWDEGTSTAALAFDGGLADGQYRLLVCDTLTDPAGNALDGDGDGVAGGDFARTFRVETRSRFTNAHLDCDLRDWIELETLPTEIVHDAEDVAGAGVSGSARLTNGSTGPDLAIAQCVATAPGAVLDFSLAARVEVMGGAVALARRCEFFAVADCAGPVVGSGLDAILQPSTAGAWVRLTSPFVASPEATAALCAVTVAPPSGSTADVRLDDVRLDERPLFANGFESGDTSAWSSTVP